MMQTSNVVAFAPANDDHFTRLERDGFVVLDGVLDERQCQALSRELEPWFEATPRCQGDFYGWNTTRVGGLLSKAPSVRNLVLDPYILAIAEALLKPIATASSST